MRIGFRIKSHLIVAYGLRQKAYSWGEAPLLI